MAPRKFFCRGCNSLGSIAVGALNPILILANQAQKTLQDWPLIVRIPYGREAHVKIPRNTPMVSDGAETG
jgi:hypothetical protein